MNWKFCAKSTLEEYEILEKKNKGFENIELHSRLNDFYINADSVLHIMQQNNMQFLVVHAPFQDNVNEQNIFTGTSTLDEDVHMQSLKTLKQTLDLSDKLLTASDRYIVVHPASELHVSTEFKDILYFGKNKKNEKIREARELSIKNTFESFKQLLPIAEQKNIVVCLENFPSFVGLGDVGNFCSFVYEDDFQRVFEQIDSPNLMMTLDICHLLTQARIMKMIYHKGQIIGCNLHEDIEKYEDIIKQDDYEILMVEKYLETFKDKIGVIHLNNVVEFGMSKATHSYKFTKNDILFLTRVFRKLKEIDYKNVITLEINEDDYANVVNVQETYATIQKVLKENF
jgi:sugar phosphate isomerase/epimerase